MYILDPRRLYILLFLLLRIALRVIDASVLCSMLKISHKLVWRGSGRKKSFFQKLVHGLREKKRVMVVIHKSSISVFKSSGSTMIQHQRERIVRPINSQNSLTFDQP